MRVYTGASFFSGIGAMDYAAVAGFYGRLDIRHMCEIDPFKRKLLRKHSRLWTNAIYHEDIHDVGKTEADVFYGGFPCQDISIAFNSSGIWGTRSGLWFEMARVIRISRPRLVVLENVSNVIVRGGTVVTAQLATMGYSGVWITVPAISLEVPNIEFGGFMWVTPTATDTKVRSVGRIVRRSSGHIALDNQYRSAMRISQHVKAVEESATGTYPDGEINPRWIESLMGLPHGWVSPVTNGLPGVGNLRKRTNHPGLRRLRRHGLKKLRR